MSCPLPGSTRAQDEEDEADIALQPVLLQAVAFSQAEAQARQDGAQKILSSDSPETPREGGADIVTADGRPRAPGRRIRTVEPDGTGRLLTMKRRRPGG